MLIKKNLNFASFVLFILLFACAPAFAQFTPISYQGTLKDGSAPANGVYDFTFRVFDSSTGGTQVGFTTASDVQVTNGVFNVRLIFTTPSPFLNILNNYMEIAVRPGNSTGAYTMLTPRQEVSFVPFSILSTK